MRNIIEYLAENNKKQPEKIFCVDSFGAYSYKQAFDISLKIATFLKNQNIQNKPVMFKAERNNVSLLTLLGIVMSNNHFVPINPTFPQEKIDSIISDADIKFQIVFDNENQDVQKSNLISYNFEDMLKISTTQNDYEDLKQNFNANNNLYTIFTSGSTGKPKGVLKTQKNAISYIQNFLQTFKFDNDLKIANQSPLFFDASMKDVLLALATCSTLYFPDKSLFAMPMKLVEYLNVNHINYVCWVPSALTIIVRLNTFKYIKPTDLKYVFFVGEVFMPKYLNMWLKELPNIVYCNLYGSTEIAGICLYKIIDHILDEDKPIPLGKALANNKVYLVDGEITVESDQIATKYLNDEEKNKKVFLFENGKKILKTGDFAMIDNQNDIVFLSRKDFQIKHMGYRIELQEIEISVSSLKYVDCCAVLYSASTDKIVAFISLNTQLENAVKQILNDLKIKLAPYMMPNKIEILSELPLNANGKIDRTKLKQLLGE